MEINELRDKRKDLERDITAAVFELVEKFKTETGFSPYQIGINLVMVQNMGSAERMYVVSGCDVGIDI